MNNKGFTLVEILTVLVILSIIITFTTYMIGSTYSITEEDIKEISINNIESTSKIYIYEFSSEVNWLDSSDNSEYCCILVGDLIKVGYFNDSILNDIVKSDNYIKVIRDKTTYNITSSEYLYDNNC